MAWGVYRCLYAHTMLPYNREAVRALGGWLLSGGIQAHVAEGAGARARQRYGTGIQVYRSCLCWNRNRWWFDSCGLAWNRNTGRDTRWWNCCVSSGKVGRCQVAPERIPYCTFRDYTCCLYKRGSHVNFSFARPRSPLVYGDLAWTTAASKSHAFIAISTSSCNSNCVCWSGSLER